MAANRLLDKHKESHAVSTKKVPKVPKLDHLISVQNEEATPRLNIAFSHCNINTFATKQTGKLPCTIKVSISKAHVACAIDDLRLSNTILKVIFIHPSPNKSCVANPGLTITNSSFTNTNAAKSSTIAFKSFEANKQQIQVLIQNLSLSNFPMTFDSSNSSNISAMLTNVTVKGGKHTGYSTLEFNRLSNVFLSGNCTFSNNYWSAIVCRNTLLYLNDSINFYHNNE